MLRLRNTFVKPAILSPGYQETKWREVICPGRRTVVRLTGSRALDTHNRLFVIDSHSAPPFGVDRLPSQDCLPAGVCVSPFICVNS